MLFKTSEPFMHSMASRSFTVDGMTVPYEDVLNKTNLLNDIHTGPGWHRQTGDRHSG